MIRITDKAFHYTTSFNTDLKKKFRKLEHDRRAAATRSAVAEPSAANSVVSITARRNVPTA